MAEHERNWARWGDPDRPKASKSKHKASDYLLSGLLVARQDGGGLVGVLCGRVGKKVLPAPARAHRVSQSQRL